MNTFSWLQLILYIAVLLALAKPLGGFMARVFQGEHTFLDRVLRPVERLIYSASGVRTEDDLDWKTYAVAMMVFNVMGLLAVCGLQRLRAVLPLNPQGLGAVTPDSCWYTAVSFATNTNWQGCGGEVTMSFLSRMLGLAVQNFVSVATGMAVLVALLLVSQGMVQTFGDYQSVPLLQPTTANRPDGRVRRDPRLESDVLRGVGGLMLKRVHAL